MYCRHCGAEAPAGSKFCRSCGKPFGMTVDDSNSTITIETKGPRVGREILKFMGLALLVFSYLFVIFMVLATGLLALLVIRGDAFAGIGWIVVTGWIVVIFCLAYIMYYRGRNEG